MGVKADKRKIYKADGVIHLAGNEDLEVLVLKKAGPFCRKDHAKIIFDDSKGVFALLAMIKTVADVPWSRVLKKALVTPFDFA